MPEGMACAGAAARIRAREAAVRAVGSSKKCRPATAG